MVQCTHHKGCDKGRGGRPPFDRKTICHIRLQQERRPISSDQLLRPDYIILMVLPLDSGKGSWTALYRR